MGGVPAYVAVDWGTSSFRLWLLDSKNEIVGERRSNEGMTTAAKTGFSEVLESHLAALDAPRDIPVIVCGMAGAKQGWKEAGYVDVPTPLNAVLTGAVRIAGESRDVRILPGLAQRAIETPDVIRGEETQLLGALSGNDHSTGDQLVCMPGTHSKWVRVEKGVVAGFSTFMTGELFDVISKYSILSHALAAADSKKPDDAAFSAAITAAFERPAMASSLIFGCRAGQLLHAISSEAAAARLSGTLIGLELAGAISSASKDSAITLVASGHLQKLYEAAFRTLSLTYNTIDADAAVRRGLAAAAQAIWPQLKGH